MTHDQPQSSEPNQPQSQPTAPPSPEVTAAIDAETADVETPTGVGSRPDESLAASATASEGASDQDTEAASGETVGAAVENGADERSEVAAIDVAAGETDQPPPASLPSVESASSPKASSLAEPASKSRALWRLLQQLGGIIVAFLPILGNWLRAAGKGLLVVLSWIYAAWKALLPRIRSLLPVGWNKLPDWVLTTVAATLLIFVVWLTVQLLPGQPPALVSDRTPPRLKAPAPAQPVAVTPDPALIARIQAQMSEITNEYAEELIQSVQADVGDNQLIVQLSPSWYSLTPARQNQLANDLFARSRQLKFDALEIVDTEGERLARSPVVGNKMVMYGRLKAESIPSNLARTAA
jgi:hypothetical protein